MTAWIKTIIYPVSDIAHRLVISTLMTFGNGCNGSSTWAHNRGRRLLRLAEAS